MKIATSTCCITPEKKVTLGCNGYNFMPFESIDSDIEINAIRLMQNNTNVLIISVDTLFVTNEIKMFAIDHLKDKLPLNEDQVFIAASHTHYAPFLDASKPNLGSVDDEYMVFFKSQLSLLLDNLVQAELIECDLIYGESESDGVSVGRRKYAWGFWKRFILTKSMRIFPNSKTPIDSTVRTFKFIDKRTGKPVAILWNFACHPVMYHNPKHITAHFPGDVREEIREILGDIPVMFLQGFSGDIRPFNTGGSSLKEKFLGILNKESGFKTFSDASYGQWVKKITGNVIGCINNKKSQIKDLALRVNLTKCSTKQFVEGSDQPVIFQSIELSGEHIILGVSAEVVSKYALELQKIYPNKTMIPVGCVGTVFGYWPTKEMLKEGGYEVNNFKKGFSFKGDFNKEAIENVFFESIKKIIK